MDSDQRILAKFIQNHPKEAAKIVEDATEEERLALIASLPLGSSAQLLSQMDRRKAALILEKVDFGTAIKLLEHWPATIAELLLRQLDETYCNALLDGLTLKTSITLKHLLSYPKNVVGAYLDPMVFTLTDDLTVRQGLDRIKKDLPPALPYVFVLSRSHTLVGMIGLQQLITTKGNKPIQSIMNTSPPKTIASMDVSVLAEGRVWDDSLSYLAVVDADNIFLGIISRGAIANIKQVKPSYKQQAVQTSSALGELYQIGVSSFFSSVAETGESKKNK